MKSWNVNVWVPKDTIDTKLALLPWIDDNLGHTLSGLRQIVNIIGKILIKFSNYFMSYIDLLYSSVDRALDS